MSDRGRYRKIYPRLFRHPGFSRLTADEQMLTIYLLAGPQTNRIGLYHLSIPAAAEELGSVPQTIARRLSNVCLTFGWLFDATARVFYIPSWWRWNPPENQFVMIGNLKDLSDIRPCALVDQFARNLAHVPEAMHQTFLEGLQRRLPECLPAQYQDQDLNQEQEQKPALRAKGGSDEKVPPRVKSIAKQVLRDANGRTDSEYLIDATLATCKAERIPVTRTLAKRALIAMTPEGRAS